MRQRQPRFLPIMVRTRISILVRIRTLMRMSIHIERVIPPLTLRLLTMIPMPSILSRWTWSPRAIHPRRI